MKTLNIVLIDLQNGLADYIALNVESKLYDYYYAYYWAV